MTSSSNPPLERGLDTMILVYSMLQGHPAQPASEQLLRRHSGWFSTPWVLFEAKGVLTKIYGETPVDATRKLSQVISLPVALLDIDPADVPTVFGLADTHALDLTDAILLYLARTNRAAYLATEDQRLTQVCMQFGITPVSPLDAALRQQVAAWETANLRPKGMARIMHRVHHWLAQTHPSAAQDFWSQTGGGNHLP